MLVFYSLLALELALSAVTAVSLIRALQYQTARKPKAEKHWNTKVLLSGDDGTPWIKIVDHGVL
jgi:hypothetical protein